MPNPLKELENFGQSVWLDYIRRSLITSGELARLIVDDGLRGVTSNPAIFEKAMAGSSDYESALRELEGLSIEEIATILSVKPSTVKVRLHRARKRMLEDLRRWKQGG